MAQLKQAADKLRAQIDTLVDENVTAVVAAIRRKGPSSQRGTDFENATPAAQQAALAAIDTWIASIQSAREISQIREARTTFEITQLSGAARPARRGGPAKPARIRWQHA